MMTNTALMNEGLKKLLEAIAGREGITVTFDQQCTVPYASVNRVITMPPPSAVDSQMYWVYAYHELGHLMDEMGWTYKGLQKVISMEDKLVQGVANILVDTFQECNLYGRYEGVDNIQDWGRAWVLNDWFDEEHKITQAQADPVMSLIYGLIIVDAETRQEWAGHLVEAFDVEGKARLFPETVDALRSINVPQRISAIRDSVSSDTKKTDATKQLILDILKLIGYEPPPPQGEGEGEGQGEGEGEGEGQGDCQACEGSGEQEDGEGGTEPCEACGGTGKEGEGDGDEGDGRQSEQGTEQNLQESDPMYNPDGIGSGQGGKGINQVGDVSAEGLERIMKALGHNLEEALAKQPKRHYLENYKQGAAGYVPYAKTKVVDVEKDRGMYPRDQYKRMIASALGNSTVSKQIAKYLKAMSTESYTYGQRSGKLHQKNMHKLINGQPIPGVQPGIFKRKNASVLKTDCAVTILVDCSGSMSGSKYAIASAASVALNETLTGLRVPHEVLGFTEEYVPTHYVFKSFSGTMTREKMLNTMASSKVSMGCNADGESVMWAAERLATRTEPRKLLVVLSDGMPAGGYSGDGNAYLKHVANLIETESNIDLVGIGIRTEAPKRFYRTYKILEDASKLDEVLFTLLREFLV